MGTLARSLISGGLKFGANQLFGVSDEQILSPVLNFQAAPLSFNAGGLSGTTLNSSFNVNPTSSQRDNLIGQQRTALGNFSGS